MKVGDLVRVKQSGGRKGPTRYEITSIGPGTSCSIREWPDPAPKGKRSASQDFDTSLLVLDNSGPALLGQMIGLRV